jgi:hypothetical protein
MIENLALLNWWAATGILFLELALLGKLASLLIVTFAGGEFKKSFTNIVYKN